MGNAILYNQGGGAGLELKGKTILVKPALGATIQKGEFLGQYKKLNYESNSSSIGHNDCVFYIDKLGIFLIFGTNDSYGASNFGTCYAFDIKDYSFKWNQPLGGTYTSGDGDEIEPKIDYENGYVYYLHRVNNNYRELYRRKINSTGLGSPERLTNYQTGAERLAWNEHLLYVLKDYIIVGGENSVNRLFYSIKENKIYPNDTNISITSLYHLGENLFLLNGNQLATITEVLDENSQITKLTITIIATNSEYSVGISWIPKFGKAFYFEGKYLYTIDYDFNTLSILRQEIKNGYSTSVVNYIHQLVPERYYFANPKMGKLSWCYYNQISYNNIIKKRFILDKNGEIEEKIIDNIYHPAGPFLENFSLFHNTSDNVLSLDIRNTDYYIVGTEPKVALESCSYLDENAHEGVPGISAI